MSFYNGKRILVTGGTGLIGRPLVDRLVALGAVVTVVSLDDPARAPEGVTFHQADLRDFFQALRACEGQEIVFHLAGVKGSPAMTAQKPASFLTPMLLFNTNMMEAARQSGVERYLYTSSIGVYEPAPVFHEDSVWKTHPSPNDRFAGWAKRMGELQAEAYRIEYDWQCISIVRPANVYGPFDNFDERNAMVIPSLIKRALSGESPLVVWGDGSPIRDFIYSDDVARGMLMAVEQGISEPLNLGSGEGVSIKTLAETVAKAVPGGPIPIEWDTSKPMGDKRRLMDMTRAASYGFICETSIEKGIASTIDWYLNNQELLEKRYNSFTENV